METLVIFCGFVSVFLFLILLILIQSDKIGYKNIVEMGYAYVGKFDECKMTDIPVAMVCSIAMMLIVSCVLYLGVAANYAVVIVIFTIILGMVFYFGPISGFREAYKARVEWVAKQSNSNN